MRLLPDTCTFPWLATEGSELSNAERGLRRPRQHGMTYVYLRTRRAGRIRSPRGTQLATMSSAR